MLVIDEHGKQVVFVADDRTRSFLDVDGVVVLCQDEGQAATLDAEDAGELVLLLVDVLRAEVDAGQEAVADPCYETLLCAFFHFEKFELLEQLSVHFSGQKLLQVQREALHEGSKAFNG